MYIVHRGYTISHLLLIGRADDKFMSFVLSKKTKKSLNKTECLDSTKINYLFE